MHNRADVYLKEDGARLSEFALLASVVWVLHLLQVSGQSEGWAKAASIVAAQQWDNLAVRASDWLVSEQLTDKES